MFSLSFKWAAISGYMQLPWLQQLINRVRNLGNVFKWFLWIGNNLDKGNEAHGLSFGATGTAHLVPLGTHGFCCSSGLDRVATDVTQKSGAGFPGARGGRSWEGREVQGSGTLPLDRSTHIPTKQMPQALWGEGRKGKRGGNGLIIMGDKKKPR